MCPPEGRNNLADFAIVFSVQPLCSSLTVHLTLFPLWPQHHCLEGSRFHSKTESQRSAGSRVTQPDQNALNFENDSPLGTEPTDKSRAVVIVKTERCTQHNLSN